MDSNTAPWQQRFDLQTCAGDEIATALTAKAVGIAVVYAKTESGEAVFLVLESRVGSLRDLCARRLQTAKFPTSGPLLVSYKILPLASESPEAIDAVCREQVILAGALRRELRPAMR